MAIDLLQRIDAPRGLFAVEKVTLLYSLITTVFILCFYTTLADPLQLLGDRLLILLMTLGLMYLYRIHPCRMTTYFRVIIQLTLLSYWYPDTFELNRYFPNLDHHFARLEQDIFGCQPALLFAQKFPSMWVSEALNLGYFFYYPMMLIVGTYIFVRRFDWFERWSFMLACSFYLYYIVYIFLPVVGPQFYFPAIGMDQVLAGSFPAVGDYFNYHPELAAGSAGQPGFFYSLVEASQAAGERPTAAFPSSHVGVSTILMLMAVRLSRKLFAFLFPFYVLLCMATVYIQAHYLVDSIAGFLSAFFVYGLCSFLYERYFATPFFSKPLRR